MKKISMAWFILIFFIGCTSGTNFVRPNSDEFKLNKTTYSEVINRMGEPTSSGHLTRNKEIIKHIFYGYVEKHGNALEKGIIPTRAMHIYFHNDVLVGHLFSSSFKEDNSYFDEKNIAQIKKNETTRSDVVKLLGRPSGYYTFPIVKKDDGEKIIYKYESYYGRSGGKKTKKNIKTLEIQFDLNDLVLDINYNSSENTL